MKNTWIYTFFVLLLTLSNSCKEPQTVIPEIEIGSLIDDRDTTEIITYKTVKIGNQWWMAENLKAKRFRNGKIIEHAQSEEQWKNEKSAYCIYENNKNAPGLLYNFYAVIDTSNIAPKGWHIPTDDEWKELEKHLGMNSGEVNKTGWRGTNEGEKLKIEAPKGWTTYNDVWGTNESGFDALAGSCRLFNGTFGQPGLFSTGFWWSSSINEKNAQAWYRHLDYKSKNIFRYHGEKNYGFSIRCIKD